MWPWYSRDAYACWHHLSHLSLSSVPSPLPRLPPFPQAADQLAPFDMDACLACADVHGAPLVAACTGCAGSANPGSCNICINQTRGNRCDAQ
jgi:hypothetical protein